MAERGTGEAMQNYKGLLIQYCQERGLSQPVYTETQQGPPDAPSWHVTVHYGEWVHETAEPIPGSKKFAHQVASKQILSEIDSRRESFLAGDTVEQEFIPLPPPVVSEPVPLEVPISLVSRALTIANEHLTTSQPTRYRMLSEAEFSKKLAILTLQIVRDLVERADEDEITFK